MKILNFSHVAKIITHVNPGFALSFETLTIPSSLVKDAATKFCTTYSKDVLQATKETGEKEKKKDVGKAKSTHIIMELTNTPTHMLMHKLLLMTLLSKLLLKILLSADSVLSQQTYTQVHFHTFHIFTASLSFTVQVGDISLSKEKISGTERADGSVDVLRHPTESFSVALTF